MAQLSCFRYSEFVGLGDQNLNIMARALDELSKRWPTAVGSLKHLYVSICLNYEQVLIASQYGCP
jgi:hypothetical protein